MNIIPEKPNAGFSYVAPKRQPTTAEEKIFLPNCSNNSKGGGGGGVTQTFFIRGCAILALNIAPRNPAALPKKIPINPKNKSLVRH